MRRATLACASLLLLAGLTACGDDDSDKDAKDDGTTSSSASPTDSTDPSADESSTDSAPSPSTSESDDSDDSDESTSAYCDASAEASAATTIEELRVAVDKLEENLPDDASDAAEDGLEFLQDELAKAKDIKDFTDAAQKGSKQDLENTKEYGSFESATCASDEAPTEVPEPSGSPS